MPRPRFRSLDAPWLEDEEPDWSAMTKADAIREASKLLGGEQSPILIVRYLEQRKLHVNASQAAKVLGDMKKAKTPPDLAHSVHAVVSIQKYAAEHGGVKAIAKKLAEAESLISFANTVGGLEVFKAILEQLQSAK